MTYTSIMIISRLKKAWIKESLLYNSNKINIICIIS